MDKKDMFRLTSDRKTLINVNYIQYVDIVDDEIILVKIDGKKELIKQSLGDSSEAEDMLHKEIFQKMLFWLIPSRKEKK